jgi:beta-N-acetylhexosaminidase
MSKDLTFEQSIGQHLVAGVHGTSLDDSFRNLVRNYKVGNVILFRRNIRSTRQLRKLCTDIRNFIVEETGIEPLVIINEEGGTSSCLHDKSTHIPGAMAIGATGDQGNAFTAGRIVAEELRALGIQCNLSPVLDVNSNRSNPVIGVRSYSDKPDNVAQFGTAMYRGLSEGDVLSVAKHFPGHGDTTIDSHTGLPLIEKTKEELLACELIPFMAAIDAEIPAIMTSHILVPSIEKSHVPATLSRALVTDLLRNELGYTGLVFSDCMEMGPIIEHFGTVHGTVEALRAGVDLVLISHTHQLVEEAYRAIADSFGNSYLDWEEHQQSLARLLSVKERYTLSDLPSPRIVGSEEHKDVAKAIMARAICVGNLPLDEEPDLGEHPLFMGCSHIGNAEISDGATLDTPFPQWMADHIGGRSTLTGDDPNKDDIIALMEETKGATSIVIGTCNGHLNQGQLALANAMAGTGLPTIVISLGNPYDLLYLAENIHSYAAFEYSPLAFEAIRCVLTKERSATGVLPVHW